MNIAATHKISAVLLDSGDTLVDEGTEIKDADGVVQQAQLIAGAAEMVKALKAQGYPLALVADGPAGTFYNVLGHYDLLKEFDALAISGLVGVEKPDQRMFQEALNGLHLSPSQYRNVVMVGNNLERDIKGANTLGLISVWINGSPRRSKIPADRTEQPRFTIRQPLDLLDLLATLEKNLS
jgi:putative hydrolase of the HAD superfamily